VIGADEHGDFHEGVGAEQGFCRPVELVVGAVLDREKPGKVVGNGLCLAWALAITLAPGE
jgi:hypothetical protein